MAKTMVNKKLLIGVLIGILIIVGLIFSFDGAYIDVYIDGENVTTTSFAVPFKYDTHKLNQEINQYTLKIMHDTNSNITDLKNGINNITLNHGIKNSEISIDSNYGKNQIPVIFDVNGTSMVPTIEDGQKIIVLKSKNISVGDIVVSNNSEHGIIVKRVSEIRGDQIYLTSDNKNTETININGIIYNKHGLTTWDKISNIIGVVVEY